MGRFKNAWASTALVALIVLLLGAGTGSAAIVDNLVAHWTFDDNTPGNEYLDSAGSNHGTAQGTVPALATGLIGAHTLELGGAGTINVGSSADFDTTTYSISTWLNADTTAGWRTAVGSWHGGAYWTHLGNNAGGDFGDHGGGQTSGGVVTLGQWNHVVSVRNPGVENQLWVNGVKMAQTSTGTPQIPGGNNVYIGTKNGAENWWDGKIDDVGIWDRAITSDEVREIYFKGIEGNNLTEAAAAPNTAVVCYAFDGNMFDSGQAGAVADNLDAWNSANVPGATPNYEPGVVGQAVRLGDTTGAQWVGAPDSADADVSSTYTIEAFINPDSVPGASEFQRLVLHWAGGNAYHLGIRGTAASMFHGQSNGAAVNADGGKLSAGQWYHIAATADPTDGMIRTWLNGVNVASTAYDGTIANDSNRLFLGSTPGGHHFGGLIDEVQIYDGEAKDAAYMQQRVAQVAALDPQNGLVSLYQFEGNGDDTAGGFTESTSTIVDNLSAVGDVAYGAGQVGQAADLNGGYFTVANSADVQLPSTFTVEAWINPDNPSTAWNRLLLNWSAELSYHFALRNGMVSLYIKEADGNVFEVAVGGAVAAGEWQHIAGVLDADTLTGTVFLNGVEVGSGAFDGTLFTTSTDGLGVGDSALGNGGSMRYVGLIDELAIWETALTPSQIASHYLAGADGYGLGVPEPGTLGLLVLGIVGLIPVLRRRRK